MSLKGIKIEKAYCPQNHSCPSLRVCPVGAIKQKGYSAPTIDEDECILCGKCLGTCPVFQPIEE
jgi:Fe-S-cluster-containing hydrogenase component 2